MADVIITNKSVETVVGSVDQIDATVGSGAEITVTLDSNNNPVLANVSPIAAVAVSVNAISQAQAAVGAKTEVLATLQAGAAIVVQTTELKTMLKFGQKHHFRDRTFDGEDQATQIDVYDDDIDANPSANQLFSKALTWVDGKCTLEVITDITTGAVLTITHTHDVNGNYLKSDEVLT